MGNTKRGHNEGNIKERKDGRFEVRVTTGTDFETGKQKRISYYAKTKAEAIKILHEQEYKIHFQEHIDPTATKLFCTSFRQYKTQGPYFKTSSGIL